MKKEINSILANAISFACFILSSEFIFSPLHKSQNIIISAFFAFISGFICLRVIFKVFEKQRTHQVRAKKTAGSLSIIVSSFSTVISLILITEIIKDVAYVANRNVSLFYYISLSLAILTVSYYLCCNSEKGIYRFCILSSLFFIFLFTASFTVFGSVRNAVFDFNFKTKSDIIGSILIGILSGLFTTADTCAYIYCFDGFIRKKNGKPDKHSLQYGYFGAISIIIIFNILTVLVFGSTLTADISDPDYALVKLIPGIDFTEIISAARIISFMIKSSVYIYSSSKFLKSCFGSENTGIVPFIFTQYLLIPIIVIALTIFDKTLKYGAFQHLIYPIVILFSITAAILNLLYRKKE